MVRMKLTSDLCALRESSARDTQNTVKHYEKGIHLSPGIWVREYTSIKGFCDSPLDEFIKHPHLSSLRVVGWAHKVNSDIVNSKD